MKKLIILTSGLLMLSFFTPEIYSQNTGQTLKLSKALSKVFESSMKNFTDIRGEHADGSLFKSLIQIEEGSGAVIDTADTPKWKVDLGLYKDLDQAEQQIDKFTDDFKADSIMLSFYRIKQFEFPDDIHYGAFQALSDKVTYFRITFKEVYRQNGYSLELEVSAAPDHEPLSVEFHRIQQEKVDNAFTASLQALMKEAQSNFKNIQGNLIESGFQSKYESKMGLEGAYQNIILEFITNNTFYGFLGTVNNENEVSQALDQIGAQIGEALGPDYYWSFFPDKKYLAFTLGTKLELAVNSDVRLYYMARNDGKFDIAVAVEQNFDNLYK